MSFYDIEEEKTKPKTKKKISEKGNTPKKKAREKPKKKEVQSLSAKAKAVAKNVKEKKIDGKSQKIQSHISDPSLKIFLEETPFSKINSDAIRELLVHFMLTMSQHNPKDHPKDYSQASLEKWLKQKKWQKKKNP